MKYVGSIWTITQSITISTSRIKIIVILYSPIIRYMHSCLHGKEMRHLTLDLGSKTCLTVGINKGYLIMCEYDVYYSDHLLLLYHDEPVK